METLAPLSLPRAARELGVTPEEMFDLVVLDRAVPYVLDHGGLPAITREALEAFRARRGSGS